MLHEYYRRLHKDIEKLQALKAVQDILAVERTMTQSLQDPFEQTRGLGSHDARWAARSAVVTPDLQDRLKKMDNISATGQAVTPRFL